MLWVASLLCFVVFGIVTPPDWQTMILAIVLICVVLITSTFEIYQEGKQSDVVY